MRAGSSVPGTPPRPRSDWSKSNELPGSGGGLEGNYGKKVERTAEERTRRKEENGKWGRARRNKRGRERERRGRAERDRSLFSRSDIPFYQISIPNEHGKQRGKNENHIPQLFFLFIAPLFTYTQSIYSCPLIHHQTHILPILFRIDPNTHTKKTFNPQIYPAQTSPTTLFQTAPTSASPPP